MSFTSQQNFAQQWPPGPASAAPTPDDGRSYYPHDPSYFPPPPPPPMYMANSGGFYANSVAPNISSANTLLPPPPLPFSNAMPGQRPSYGAPVVPPLGFPPFPPVPPHQPDNGIVGASAMDVAAESDTPQGRDDSPPPVENDDREEGELSNGELEEDTPPDHDENNGKSTVNPRFPRHGAPPGRENDPYHTPYDPLTTRLQAEKYNPPADGSGTLAQQPELGELSQNNSPGDSYTHGDDTEMAHVTRNESSSSASLDEESSAQQLRSLAQGALLNLAPHNIRFNELVEEGIDPLVLKSLYDEIGIKVNLETGENLPPSAQPAPSDQVDRGPGLTEDASNLVVSSVEPDEQRQDAAGNLSATGTEVPVPTTERQKSASSLERGTNMTSEAQEKPLERKDLIARMLAAKATKPTQSESTADTAPSQSAEQTKQPGQPLISSEPATMDVESSDLPSTSGDVRAKEVNKAQTELARQRMEQLKKEGLRRSQTHATDSGTASLSAPDIENGLSEQSAALQHPLPERPAETDKAAATRIPGLSMTGPEPSEVADAPTTEEKPIDRPLSTARVPRKRPRASDFTDDIPHLPPKKPTHQENGVGSSDHRVVIDISDDDSMYSADDGHAAKSLKVDSVPDFGSRPTSGLPIRSQQPLPSRNGYSNASATSSLPQDPKHLQTEIKNLRDEIAERERRLNEKAVASQVQATTRSTEEESSSLAEDNSKPAQPQVQDEDEAPRDQTERLMDSPTAVIEGPDNDTVGTVSNPAIDSEIVPREGSLSRSGLDPGKMENLRQKFLRKKEIESGLPVLEAELKKSEAKLAQFREEEKKLLSEIAKGKAGRLKLVQELEGLGVETEGLTIDELQSAKESLENDITTANVSSVLTEPTVEHDSIDHTIEHQDEPQPSGATVECPLRVSDSESTPVEGGQVSDSSAQRSADAYSDGHDFEIQEDTRASRSSSAMDESMGTEDDSAGNSSPNEPTMALEEDGPIQINSPAVEPEAVSPRSTASQGSGARLSVNKDRPEPGEFNETEVPREPSNASDAYEPPEPSNEPNSTYSPPCSPAPLDSAEQGVIGHCPDVSTQVVDELTSSGQDEMAVPIEATKDDYRDQPTQHFTPYKSLLSRFRAYRYHPQYTDSVNGGYRSLTYSHNINPHNPLCAFEASGGVCNDRSCHNQHFRDMSLSDDKILVEMGSLREGKTAQEQEDYVAGLRQIINDMRRDKVKDFTTVATEIAAYRRRFLQDPSRVLAL